MSDFYTILINDDHSFTHTNKKRIMHRSNMIDSIRFLVKPRYGVLDTTLDMTKVNTVLQYVTPVSRTYGVIVLKPSEELYKNRVEYILPINIDLTSEVGELELTINFSYLSMNEDGTFKEQVRPIGCTSITIEDTVHWPDYIADVKLDNIAQIMLTNQAIAEQNRVNIEMMQENIATGLAVDSDSKTLHLVNEDGVKMGEGVPVNELGDCDCEYGVPVVDFTVVEPDDVLVDNVVEF